MPGTDDDGFWGQLVRTMPSDLVRKYLPLSCDRFEEAVHFLDLARALEPIELFAQQANWYAGAHMTAVIGLHDAVRADYKRIGRNLRRSPLAREFFLRTDAQTPNGRDPTGINRAYRILRDLRMHFAEPILVLDDRFLVHDASTLHDDDRALIPVRWFLRSLEWPAVEMLNKNARHLNESELARFNEFASRRTFVSLASQHLWMLGLALNESYQEIASG